MSVCSRRSTARVRTIVADEKYEDDQSVEGGVSIQLPPDFDYDDEDAIRQMIAMAKAQRDRAAAAAASRTKHTPPISISFAPKSSSVTSAVVRSPSPRATSTNHQDEEGDFDDGVSRMSTGTTRTMGAASSSVGVRSSRPPTMATELEGDEVSVTGQTKDELDHEDKMLDDLHVRAFGKPRRRAPSPTPMRINIPTVPPVAPRRSSSRPRAVPPRASPSPSRSRAGGRAFSPDAAPSPRPRPTPSPLRPRPPRSSSVAGGGGGDGPDANHHASRRSLTPTTTTSPSSAPRPSPGRSSLGAPGVGGGRPPSRSRSLSRGPPPRPGGGGGGAPRDSSVPTTNDAPRRRRPHAGLSATTRRLLSRTNGGGGGGDDDASVASNSSRRSMSSRRSNGSVRSKALDDILGRIDVAKSRLSGSPSSSSTRSAASRRDASSPVERRNGNEGTGTGVDDISSQIETALMIERLASEALAVKGSE